MAVADALQRARMLTELGRYDDAAPMLAQALAEEPDNEEGLSLLAQGQLARKRYEDAAATTEQQLHAHPHSVRGLLRMAAIHRLLRRTRDGVPFARRAVELYPDNASCLVTLADVLKDISPGSAEALTLVENAIAIDPDYAEAYLVAGEIHLDVTQYLEAERWTLRALKIKPDDPWAILQLGLVRAGLGRFEESRDDVMVALRTDSGSGVIRQVIEYVECRAIPDHFAEIYRMALDASGLPDLSYPGAAGDDPELLAEQGKLAYRMNSAYFNPEGKKRAGELADTVLAADPNNQDARYVRSRALSDAERYAEALPLAEQLHSEGYPHADDALVVAQTGIGDYSGALVNIRRVRREKPESAMYLRVEAQCLRHLERYDEALQSALRAAELAPSAVQVQLQLGLAAKSAGDRAVAEQALRMAMKHTPDDGEPAAELALLCTEADRWPEAESLMATLSPDMPDVRQLIRPCIGLANACLMRAAPSLEAVDEDAPDAALLDEGAHWLNLSLDMYAIAAHGCFKGEVDFSTMMAGALSVLHKICAPEDSNFARVVRRWDAMVDSWRFE